MSDKSAIVLDRLDRKLLSELDRDARQPLSAVARKVGLGSDLVSYRFQKLVSAGILQRCSAILDPYRLGLLIGKTYLRLRADAVRLRALEKRLQSIVNVYATAQCYGRWDYVFLLYARDVREFADLQRGILAEFSDILLAVDEFIVIERTRYARQYLLKQPVQPNVIGVSRERVEIDSLERRLAELLSVDARLPVVDLAHRLKTTPSIVAYRLAKLEQGGVIAGYRTQLDLGRIGFLLFKILLEFEDYNLKREGEFLKFCAQHQHLTCVTRQTGQWKIELEAEVESHAALNTLVDDLRERFSGYIRTVEPVLVRESSYHRLPPDLR